MCMLSLMTDSTLKLREAGGGRIKPREGLGGSRYRARIMGWPVGADSVEGSSAHYPVDVIKRDFAEAFPAGTRMRANHDGFCEMGGDIKRIVAKTLTVPTAEADGMYVDMYVAEEWSKFAEEFAETIGLSISAAAAVKMVEAEDPDSGEPMMVPEMKDGKRIVERFFTAEEAPYNAIDLVEAPGADGRITRALEAARQTYEGLDIRHQSSFVEGLPQIHRILQMENAGKKTAANTSRHTQEGHEMTPEELAAKLAESRTALLAAIPAAVAEAMKPTEQPAPVVSSADVAEAVAEAGLSKFGARTVFEAHDRGEDFAPVLEREKQREASIRESLTPTTQPGTVQLGFIPRESSGSGKTDSSDLSWLRGTEGEQDLNKILEL